MTEKPAEVINRKDEIGSLSVGVEADLTILKLFDGLDTNNGRKLEDCHGQQRTLQKYVLPIAVFRAGKPFDILNWKNCTEILSKL